MQSYAMGIDIGGTKIAIGLVNTSGEVVSRSVLSTNLTISPQDMMLEVAKEVNRLVEQQHLLKEDLLGVGIGAPGPIDAPDGMITCPPNLPNWVDFPVVQFMQEALGLTVTLQNDANCAALAEKWIGAAQDANSFVYVTISTGIGSGIYVDGRMLSGLRGNAGDIGHIVIDPSQGTCTCGQKGCFEWIASGTAIARRASDALLRNVSTKEVFELYANHDNTIVPIIAQTFEYIGMGCVTLINMLDPEMIVIGGGVSSVGDPLFDAARRYVRQFALNPAGRETRIVKAQLGSDAGLIGAAALVVRNARD